MKLASHMHRALLNWYAKHARVLPWRKNVDPYRIWISEIMLQQTRVETVLPYYERFLTHFPNVQALADANPDTLTSLWAGLGYYSRARNLQTAAKDIVARFGGTMPSTKEELQSLKGIGDYTAAAIASIAFGQNEIALDGNLERVLSRVLAFTGDPKSKEGRTVLRGFGEKLVALGNASAVNQGLMDLSSQVCGIKNPKCGECPLVDFCEGRKQNLLAQIPFKKAKTAAIELNSHGLLLLCEPERGEKSLLLARRKTGDWLAGLWDLPWWLSDEAPAPKKTVKFGEHKSIRTITKHKIQYNVHFHRSSTELQRAELENFLPDCAAEFRWQPLTKLDQVNLPKPSEKALAQALKGI